MNKVLTLLSLELRALYGINKFLYCKDKREKNRYRLLGAVWVLLIVMVFFYVGGLTYGLCALGLGEIVPMYLVVLASALILMFGIFTAGSRIFARKGYDILTSMPVKPSSIVTSRFLALYAEDLLFTLVIMLPGIVTYGVCAQPKLGFYVAAMLGSLLIPALPLVISVLVGSCILAISSRMKHKSLVQTALMLLLVVGVLVGSFSMESLAADLNPEVLSELARTAGDLFAHIYPPAVWLGNAMLGTNPAGFALFALLSLAVMAFAVLLIARYFHPISRRLMRFSAKHDYKIGAMQSRGVLKALYLRELKRYFSSSIYVTNTIIGPIMGTIMAVAICVAGLDTVQSMLPFDVAAVLPFVFAAVFCTMTTTSVSISMEGKQFRIVKSLPIPTKTLLDSKLLLNLSLMLPCYIVSEIAFLLALRPKPMQFLWLLLIPAAVILFSVVFGITVNLKFHSFDWEKEETIVKQSLPAMLGGFAGFFVSAVLGAAVPAVPPQFADLASALVCAGLLAATALLYHSNNRKILSAL